MFAPAFEWKCSPSADTGAARCLSAVSPDGGRDDPLNSVHCSVSERVLLF